MTARWPKQYDAPQFQHDCDVCQFIGRYIDPHGDRRSAYDLYWHDYTDDDGTRFVTVVARYGSEGPNYSSGHWDTNALNEARRRVIDNMGVSA